MIAQAPKPLSPPAKSSTTPTIAWDPLPPDYPLPDDPVENIQQPFLAAALTDALGTDDRIRPDMLIASNFALVATVNDKPVIKAPDWLWVASVQPSETEPRRSYTPNLEGDPVAIVMEFLSETEAGEYSAKSTHPYGKFYFYEQILKVPTYVIFDPATALLEVYELQGGHYKLQSATGRHWIEPLKLWLGTWQGDRLGINTYWLRWWDDSGQLLPWGFEKAKEEADRANQEALRANQEALRANQETLRASQESDRANQEALRANQEADRANQEALRASQETDRANQERQARLDAISRLLAMGLTDTQVAEALGLPIEEVRGQA
jgi:Uma2 family endonuclease